MVNRCARLLPLAVVLVCSTVRAQLFDLNASSSTTSVNANGSSLINLVDHLTSTTNQFSSLSNQSFNANLKYAGIPSAITFQQSFDISGNRVVSVQVPSVGLNKTSAPPTEVFHRRSKLIFSTMVWPI